jgi:glycerol-3-phosphate dehydrogenase (NAD(P)+)
MVLKKNTKNSPKVAVLGDGSWPTALIKILSENKIDIRWWVRKELDVEYIKDKWHNPTYLSSVYFDKKYLKPSSSAKKVVSGSDYVLVAVPAAYVKGVLDQLSPDAFEGKKIITAIKGMIPEENILVSEYLMKYFNVDEKDIAIISGPCHAEEVAMGKQSYLTLGTLDQDRFEEVIDMFTGAYTKVSVLGDVVGIEYAAIMKNIYALACGVSFGLNFGDNFQAVLVSNAMQEIATFLNKVYPNANRDLSKSPYLGDLLVTTYSQFSRNRTLGTMVGRGYTVKTALIEMKMVAEGYYATKSLKAVLETNKLYLPICEAVYHVMYDNVSPLVEYQLLKAKLS